MKFPSLKLNSINKRIIIGAIIVVTLFIFLTGYTLNKAFYNNAYSALKERLTGQIYLLMADRELNSFNPQNSPQKLTADLLNHDTSLSAYITRADGSILWRSTGSDPAQLPPGKILFHGKIVHGKKVFQTFKVHSKSYISLSIAIFWDLKNRKTPLIYHISDDLSELYQTIDSYQKSLWTHLLLMSITLLISLFFMLRWGLKPLREVEQEIKAVEQGEQELLQQSYPMELKPLTRNINELIRYERQQQERYRNALADLAHSLKTPLAIIQGQHFDQQNPEVYIEQINQAVQRINNIVEYQLQRGSTTSPSPHIQYLQLEPVVQSLIDSMKKIYRVKNIHFTSSITPGVQYKMDEGDFMEILGNLLDNACKWCKDSIYITIRQHSNQLNIIIEDNGPGIETEKINSITRRGVRIDELTPGHGVGLAIVQDIVTSYNGSINFNTSDKGGLKVQVLFKL